MIKVTQDEIWNLYFAKIVDREILDLLEQLKKIPKGTQLATTKENSSQMLALIDKLRSRGVPLFQSLLYKVASGEKPLLSDFYKNAQFSKEEKIQILSQFVSHKENEYPMLDLSRQNLDFIPEEIDLVAIDGVDIGLGDDFKNYKEINLGYNPQLTNITQSDFLRLNHFEGIHFISSKIEKFSSDIKLLTHAIMLNFSWSSINEIPDEVYELTNLRGLKLNWTGIENFSEKIIKLENLSFLELAETPFMETIHQLETKKDNLTEHEEEVKKIQAILKQMKCELEE